MHRRQLADEQLLVLQSAASAPSGEGSSHSRTREQAGSRFGDYNDGDSGDDTSLEPPPPYHEESIFLSSTQSSSTGSNPFLRNYHHTSRAPPQELRHSDQAFTPRLAPQVTPSAPLLTLLASTSGRPEHPIATNTQVNQRKYTADEVPSVSVSDPSTRKGKRSMRRRRKGSISNSGDESVVFGGQPAMSPSYMHPSASVNEASSSSANQGYFDPQNASRTTHFRTGRRLEHKQEFARHAASAPELYSHPSSSSSASVSSPLSRDPAISRLIHPPPIIPLSQSVVPAPPPRLLQFRSREPSSVPACPFLLCQKPIALTKTRRERGVTVWIVCGLLFLCNTYWTTQAVISQFSDPNRQDRVLSKESYEASSAAASGFTVRGEASHLLKGFLGFKTHRYKDPVARDYRRHVAELKRPTVATVGVVHDEQSAIKMVFNFLILAVMAIIRWWLCLTPLLVRPLFDTVHSCPHPHPYPYPEELELERIQLEKELADEPLPRESQYRDEKAQLRQRDETEAAASSTQDLRRESPKSREAHGDMVAAADESQNGMLLEKQRGYRADLGAEGQSVISPSVPKSTFSDASEAKAESAQPIAEHKQGRFRFFHRRRRADRQESQGPEWQALPAAVTQTKKKKLSWSTRRAFRKAEERRQGVVKASQDIGRYSLLYELGAYFFMDRWKQTVLAPGEVQPEAYED
ncbi:hypothetical protein BGZ58_002400 [Dissophora ornata]|nr:hypothetical protein BGZ58_002400 [Dissophora ornata]